MHRVIRRILADEPAALQRAEQSLMEKPLSDCLSREEAQVWIAFHANDIARVRPAPPESPITRLKTDARPFLDYFVP